MNTRYVRVNVKEITKVQRITFSVMDVGQPGRWGRADGRRRGRKLSICIIQRLIVMTTWVRHKPVYYVIIHSTKIQVKQWTFYDALYCCYLGHKDLPTSVQVRPKWIIANWTELHLRKLKKKQKTLTLQWMFKPKLHLFTSLINHQAEADVGLCYDQQSVHVSRTITDHWT